MWQIIFRVREIISWRFYSNLVEIFSERTVWEISGKYGAESVNVYSEIFNKNKSATKITKIKKKFMLNRSINIIKVVCPINNETTIFLVIISGGQSQNRTIYKINI